MPPTRLLAVVAVTVEHEAGPYAHDDLVLAELERQIRGLGPLVVDALGIGGTSVWAVADAMTEPGGTE